MQCHMKKLRQLYHSVTKSVSYVRLMSLILSQMIWYDDLTHFCQWKKSSEHFFQHLRFKYGKKLNIVLINYLPWGFISNLEIKLLFASVRFVEFISLCFHAILWRQLETNPSQSTRDLWRRHQSERKLSSSRGIR